MLSLLAQAVPAAPTTVDPSAQPPFWMQFVPFVLIFALVYFAMIRPQSTARKQQEALIKGAKTGDKIVTTGGIIGLITNVKDNTILLKIADNVKIEIEKAHIARVLKEESAEAK